MTVSVQISVNGNYKLPFKYKQGEWEVTGEISGKGLNEPKVEYIQFSHGPDVMTLELGPEEPDSE